MTEKILEVALNECSMTVDDLKTFVNDSDKSSTYEKLKKRLDVNKKHQEAEIRKHFEELKNKEIAHIYNNYQKAETFILHLLNLNVIKRKRPISSTIKDTLWTHKYGEELFNVLCCACQKKNIAKTNCKIGYLVPESKAGTNELTNLVPLCDDCHEKSTKLKLNLVEYRNKINQIEQYDVLFDYLVKKYYLFHYDNTTFEISLPDTFSEMEHYMCLCQSQFDRMNEDYNKHLDIDTMKFCDIIDFNDTLDLTDQTGNNNEMCYMVNIVLLYHYLKLMEPYKENPNKKFLFGINSLYSNVNKPNIFAKTPSVTFGTDTEMIME